MPDLFFPQLTSGALAQYPVRKTRVGRTVKNILPDGTLIAYPDPNASRFVWQLGYSGLSASDLSALAAVFKACEGRLHAFTFIDPADNMLANSANLSASAWHLSSPVEITANCQDPNGGASAFRVSNTSAVSQDIAQTLNVPASYAYCWSAYVLSAQRSTLELVRQGSTDQKVDTLAIGPNWTRVVSSGKLQDTSSSFTVSLRLAPGQSVCLYGLQLEAQLAPSRYKPTLQQGGVYSTAHWGADQLPICADAPDSFSTTLSIEASL